jgi:glyceraldehyde 3-phosphate dehydrogenase
MKSMARVAINGFGRIGRAFFKLALARPELEIVAVNDLGDPEFLAYLLRYDSVYRRYGEPVGVAERDGKKYLTVGGREVLFLQEKEPTKLPWKNLGIDVVVESTGVFETYEKMKVHLDAGAKRVVLTAPAKDDDGPNGKTVLLGINEDQFAAVTLTSNGSCTTNSLSPVMQILVDTVGVKKAYLNTVHSYTATQALIDGPIARTKDFRRGRAAAVNIAPSSTGAAIALGRVISPLTGKFDGLALRVPTPSGSLSAITFVSGRPTTKEELNQLFRDAEGQDRWKGVLRTTEDQIVSADIIGDPHAAIVDLSLTKVVDGDLCAVYSWYDNEFGYTNALVEHVLKAVRVI